jgi:eukaryotic-like serine/threonine-protein kinase
MTHPPRDPHSSRDAAREILDDWDPFTSVNDVDAEPHQTGHDLNPSAQDKPRKSADSTGASGPHFSWKDLDRADPAVPRPFSSPDGALGQSRELLAGFEIEQSQPLWASTEARRAHDSPPAADEAGARARPTSSEHDASSTRMSPALPQPGDLLAGFRIVLELGRGAFARVYLAEEVSLGGRPVAIKVSRPDGNEPQMLARLQHTHIVPVHSAYDDPESGLRVLCMPYFGGANLARVLEASGGLMPTHHDGRSLVQALDEVSRGFTSQSKRALYPSGSVRRNRASRSSPAASPVPPSHLPLDRPAENQAASRFRSLLTRWVGPSAVSPAMLEEREADHGQPSRQFLHGASAIQAAVWIVARLAEGLEHAHSRGLLHRDLKPANILLASDGTPMLLDFNLSVEALPQAGESEIRRAFVGGTLPYMSPEHLDAFNPRGSTAPDSVDERSDIYAMGLILFEMLAGEPAFPEVSPGGSLLDAIELMVAARREVPSLRARCPGLPWSLDALVAKCLAFDRVDRFARARDLAEDLHRFLENLPMKHGPEPSFRERMGKFARRHPALCGTTSITLISIVLIAFLGTAVVKTYGVLGDVYARVKVRQFDRSFTEVQFLLNTASGSDDRLKRGLRKVSHELNDLRAGTGAPPGTSGWPARLSATEQKRFREQLVEMIMLEARARVTLAKRHGTEREHGAEIKRAIDCLGEAEQIDREVPSALYLDRARYHAALGMAWLAASDRARAAARQPTTCHELTLAATTLFAAGDLAGAESALRRALVRDLTSFWTWYVLGHCHFSQRRYLEAAGDFAACAARDPNFAWVHFNRGLALAKAGRLLDARESYDRALEIENGFPEARVNRALVELELNQLECARDDLIQAIKLGQSDVVVLVALGETWARLGQRQESERYFATVLDQDPGNLVARIARGMTRIASDPRGAEDDFRRALEMDERSAHAHYGMARLVRKANPRSALDHLDRSLASDPNLIDAVQLRALVRARLGERGALDDVDRLVESATADRLYNAACAVAILSETANDARLISHAIDLLTLALKAGFPVQYTAADPDLKPLRASPRFSELTGGVPRSQSSG